MWTRHSRAVLVHQLSKQHSQNPFQKHKGQIVRVLFHPSRPFLFVATKMRVSVYNLKKAELAKKLMTGLDEISSMAIHPGGKGPLLRWFRAAADRVDERQGCNRKLFVVCWFAGDNLLLGSKEAKLVWFDLDLSTKPYKTVK